MSTRSISFSAQDDYSLAGNLYEPKLPNARTVIISGATGVLQGYYAGYAQYLCDAGFLVLTYDYRGIGASSNKPDDAPEPRMQDWGEQDLPAAIKWCRENCPNNQLLGVGHSIGGQMIGLAHNRDELSAQLNVASQYAHWSHWRQQPERFNSWLFFHLILPSITKIMGYFPGKILGSESLPVGVALDWARWGRQGNYNALSKAAPISKGFADYAGKLRFYGFTDDKKFAPPETVEKMPDLYQGANSDVIIKHPLDYDMSSIGHFGFFKSSMNKTAWQETSSWLLHV